tara:strand:+ start:340 stop:1650 length:1311 start_codon:yes stop_codon:yes gene_type:complete
MKPNRVLILGAGISGMSCVRHLYGERDLVVCDTRFETDQSPIPNSKTFYQDFPEASLINPKDFDRTIGSVSTLIVSPGLPLNHCFVQKALSNGIELISDLDLFMDAVDGPVIGITGTNGKSTVTTLVGAMLEDQAFGVGGNLGPPALDLLDDGFAGYVLELSSFQLERMRAKHFDVASIINISDDHLDRHQSIEAYATVKRRIYRDCNFAVFNNDDPLSRPPDDVQSVAVNGDARWRVTEKGVLIDGRFVPNDAIKLTGDHNRFNVVTAAAIAYCASARVDTCEQAIRTFEGLPHRVQVVGVIDDVTYVNDSKATNLGSCIAALEGVITQPSSRKIVLIAGGVGKNANFSVLGRTISGRVRSVVLIGRDAKVIAKSIPEARVVFASSLEDAVVTARMEAVSGDVVLFSPACASYDMFENFVVRGQAFTRIVEGMST